MNDVSEILREAPPLYSRDADQRRPLELESIWPKLLHMAAEPWPKLLRAPIKFGLSASEEPLWYALDVSDGPESEIVLAVRAYRGGREEPDSFKATLRQPPAEDELARVVVSLLTQAAERWAAGA